MIGGGWFRPVRWRVKMWISLGLLMQFYPLVSPLLILFVMSGIIVLLMVCIIFIVLQGQRAASSERPDSQARIQTSRTQATQKPPLKAWKPTIHQLRVKICQCGKWNAMNESLCWNCQAHLIPSNTRTEIITVEPALHCAVCNYDVKPRERISLCPACHAQGHRIHMLEFVKAKGSCPACRQPLQPAQLLDIVIRKRTPSGPPSSEIE